MTKLLSDEDVLAPMKSGIRLMSDDEILGSAPAKKPATGDGGFLSAVKQGIGSTIKGAGQVAGDYLPGVSQGNSLKQYGQSVIDANPTKVQSLSDIADSPGLAVREAAGNAGSSMASMAGVYAAGQGITALSPLAGPFAPAVAGVGQGISWLGPWAVAALPSYGGIRDQQIKDDPTRVDDAGAKALAAAGAAAVGGIERFGPNDWAMKALGKEGRATLQKQFAAKTLPGTIGKGIAQGAAIEGAEELAQNPIEQLAGYQDPTTGENIKDTLFSGAMGAIGGGVLGGPMAGLTHRGAKPAEAAPEAPAAPIEPPKLEASGPLSAAVNAGIDSGATSIAATPLAPDVAAASPLSAAAQQAQPAEVGDQDFQRLAELELTAEQRPLTADESAEADRLQAAFEQQDAMAAAGQQAPAATQAAEAAPTVPAQAEPMAKPAAGPQAQTKKVAADDLAPFMATRNDKQLTNLSGAGQRTEVRQAAQQEIARRGAGQVAAAQIGDQIGDRQAAPADQNTIKNEIPSAATVPGDQVSTATAEIKKPAAKRTGPATRDDLVGAILRVTGNRGISAASAQTITGDKAGSANAKLRALFTNDGTADLDDTAKLLREEEGYDVRDGNQLSELIRQQASGSPVYSMARQTRDAEAAKDKAHRAEILVRAKKLGIKQVGRKFSDVEQAVFSEIENRHNEAIAKLDARAKARYDAMLKHALDVADMAEVDAILTDAQARFSGRRFFTEATAQLRGYIDDLTLERQINKEQPNAAIDDEQGTTAEPDWLRDDGRGSEGVGGGRDSAAPDEGIRQAAGRESQAAAEVAPLELTGQTNEEAAADLAQQKAAQEQEAADKKAAEQKTKADAEANDFRLVGSDRAADVAVAGGQAGLFGANGQPTKESAATVADDGFLDAQKVKDGYAHRALGGLSSKVEMERKWHADAIQNFRDELSPLARNGAQKEKLASLITEFSKEYRDRRHKVLRVGETVVSGAVAGRSNFNSAQSERRGNALDAAERDFSNWLSNSASDAKSQLLKLRTQDERASDNADAEQLRTKKALRPIINDLAMIGSIDLGQSPGMDRGSFVAGAVRKIANLHKAGDNAVLGKVFEQIAKWDESHAKPLFGKKSKVWEYAPAEQEQPTKEAKAKPAKPKASTNTALAEDAAAKAAPISEMDMLKAEMGQAIGELASILGVKQNLTPEEESRIIPVMSKIFRIAAKMGYIKFKDSAMYVLGQIRELAGSEVANKLSIENLQAGYINIAKEIGGDKREAMSYDSIKELENADVTDQRSSPDLERNRQDADPENGMGAEGVRPGRDGNGGAGRPGMEGAEADRGQRSGERSGEDEAAAAGERGDIEIYTGATDVSGSSAGSGVDIGSRDSGISGLPIEPPAAGQVAATATSDFQKQQDRVEQRQADKTAPVSPGIESVRAALPILTAGQQEDVVKAEARFAKPDGYGMLFTNGTGTGKTFSGLGVIKRFANAGKTNVLIVAPNDEIIGAWQKAGKLLGLDIARLADTTDAGQGVTITTYANMGANNALASRAWDLVVHDEAHYLAMDKDGTNTNALKTLRAITMHPDGAYQRHAMLNADEIAERETLFALAAEQEKSTDPEERANASKTKVKAEALKRSLQAKQDAIKAEIAAAQGEKRPRVAFLSATPFAYEKTVDWANGYLFDYNEGRASEENSFRGYNAGSNRDQFMMQHFGYRMRYNKLTEPDAKVDRGLMQRQFNSWLKKAGALSGRMLDVAADYDRRFILVDSAIGQRIDDALQWFEVQRKARQSAHSDTEVGNRIAGMMAKVDPYVQALNSVRDTIAEKFDYLSRRYLLESIKAREVVPHIREHLAMGRKVVVFHDYKKGGGFNPFILNKMRGGQTAEERAKVENFNQVVDAFNREFRDIIDSDLFKQSSPIDMFQQEFPGVLLFNGDVPSKQRRANVAKFQDDASGPQVILVQSAAGKEGISLHDTTGKHQRVMFNLGQPTQPTTAIQQEGRIYRTGQVTDAIFRYLNTGTNWEKWAFATTIAQRASAAENLGMGEMARALKDAFISGFEESGDYRAGMEDEGKGGKERDKAANDALTEYDRARAFYFGTQKKTSKTKAQEGSDYYATPEPVGLKMVEFADVRPGESVLEPSAGHGAIARWIPEDAKRTAIEPSMALRPRLAMVFDGNILDIDFEDHNVVNKYDAIVMNPPFGTGGKMAVDHLAKAAQHLNDGGRIVALLPSGPAADKKLDKWLNGEEARTVKPIAADFSSFGPIYAGDNIAVKSQWHGEFIGKASSFSQGRLYVVKPGSSHGLGFLANEIVSVESTGPKTKLVKTAPDLYQIADIKLPSSTFERAGTQVMTHIVILEKQTDAAKASDTRGIYNRDLSGIESIGDLFDDMESMAMPRRANVEEVEAEEPAKVPAKAKKEEARQQAMKAEASAAGALVDQDKATFDLKGSKIVTNAPLREYKTKAGKVLKGVWVPDQKMAKAADAYTWNSRDFDGNYFVRIENVQRPAGAESRVAEPLNSFDKLRLYTVTSTVRQFADYFKGASALDIRTVFSREEIPDNHRPSQYAEGVYHDKDGVIYLLAKNLPTRKRAWEVLMHETVGHYGLPKMMGDEFQDLWPSILKNATASQALTADPMPGERDYATVEAVRRLYPEVSDEEVAQEVLARMAEMATPPTWARAALAKVRQWMRSVAKAIGLGYEPSMRDAKDLVLMAVEYLRKGQNLDGAEQDARGPMSSLSAKLGKTIMVDGVERPTTNSNGKPIHPTEDGVRNFWRWFGDSRVVDVDGRPLVMYHGTSMDIDFAKFKVGKRGAWFTSNEESASDYAEQNDSQKDQYNPDTRRYEKVNYSGRVIPVYLKVESPYKLTSDDRFKVNVGNYAKAQRELFSKIIGHDGILWNDALTKEWVVLSGASQIKSATGNAGSFNANKPSILESRAAINNAWQQAKAKTDELTSPDSISTLIYNYQNKYNDLKNVTQRIKDMGGTVTDLNDAYLGEEVYHSKVMKKSKDFLANEMKPLLQQLFNNGIKKDDFEQFLHARHAPERNAEMAKRNPNQAMIDAGKQQAEADVKALELQMQRAQAQGLATKAIENALEIARAERSKWNGAQAFKGAEDERLSLSGLSDDDAKKIIAAVPASKRQQYEAAAARVDAINAKTLDVQLQAGLIDKTTFDAVKKAYQHYVPLHRDEAHPDGAGHSIGQGFSVKGSGLRRATGSNEKVTNILGHIAMKREAEITRAEKNSVAKRLYLLALQNPLKDFWSVDKPPMIATVDPDTGFVRRMVDPLYKQKPNVLIVRIGGKDAAIVFNENNPEAVRLAGALKNLDGQDLDVVEKTVAQVTRWIASVNTQYNPIFGLFNLMRDAQGAALNLSTTPLAGKTAAVMKESARLFKAVAKAGFRLDKLPAADRAMWEDFQAAGGATGYRDMFFDPEERTKALEKELSAMDQGAVKKAWTATAQWLSDYNEAMENVVRIAAYSTGLQEGMSKERAASLAKNLTVNFNRKGAKAQKLGAFFAFFNASVQGTTRMAETLTGPMGRKIIAGGIALGVMQQMLGMMMMGGGDDDDEWSKIPDFIKERSLIIPASGNTYIALPLPLGFNVLPNIGRLFSEWATGGKDKPTGEQLAKLMNTIITAFNPLGGNDLVDTLSPTAADPIIALLRNKDWTGKQIYREDMNGNDPTPGFTRTKDSATPWAKGIAYAINRITGGTDYQPGAVSWTPDQIDYAIGVATGGIGREASKLAQTMAAPFSGDELPMYKVPLLGRLVGSTAGVAGQSDKFYQNIKTLNGFEREIKGRAKAGEDVGEFIDSEPRAELVGMGNAAEKQVKKLRDAQRFMKKAGDTDGAKEVDASIAAVMKGLNWEMMAAIR